MIFTTPSDPAFWRPRGLRKPPRELPERPHLPQDSPSGPKGDPKTAHEGPKRAPRRPQRAPRRPKRAPKGALESPRRAPRGSQEGPQIVQAPQDGPIQPQGCPKGPSDRAWEGKLPRDVPNPISLFGNIIWRSLTGTHQEYYGSVPGPRWERTERDAALARSDYDVVPWPPGASPGTLCVSPIWQRIWQRI